MSQSGQFLNGNTPGFVTSVTGTPNEITAAPTTGNVVLSIPATFIAPGSITSTTTMDVGTNLLMANTVAGGGTGVMQFGGSSFIHNYGSGGVNTFVGLLAGNFTNTTSLNCGFGTLTLNALTSGSLNCAFGNQSLIALTTGFSNCAYGANTGAAITTASFNSILGSNALQNCNGARNIAIGNSAGDNYTGTESSNIVIGNAGVLGESNTIRIGTQGTGAGQQDATFMAGIFNTTPSGVLNQTVIVDENGQLGTGQAMIGQWIDVTTATETMVPGAGYIANRAAGITFTLPSVCPEGGIIAVVSKANGTYAIDQNAGQTIHFGGANSTTGVGGSVTSTAQYDCLEIICITANTDFVVRHSVGNFIVV